MTNKEDNNNIGLKKITLSLAIKDISALYSAYMQFINGGGMFIPTVNTNKFKVGQLVLLVVSLCDDIDKFTTDAKIVWLTPSNAQGNKPPGIGVQFLGQNGVALQKAMETKLAGKLDSTKGGGSEATHTM